MGIEEFFLYETEDQVTPNLSSGGLEGLSRCIKESGPSYCFRGGIIANREHFSDFLFSLIVYRIRHEFDPRFAHPLLSLKTFFKNSFYFYF